LQNQDKSSYTKLTVRTWVTIGTVW
jgi:hypothetical protein